MLSNLETIFARTLSFAVEPETTLDIVDRFLEDGVVYLRLRHRETYLSERYAVSQLFRLPDGSLFIVLSTAEVPSDKLTFIVCQLPNRYQVSTLSSEQFQALSAQLKTVNVDDDFLDLSQHLGPIDDRSERLAYLRTYLSEALTHKLVCGNERVTPGSTISIDRKWQHRGIIFLSLISNPDSNAASAFRLLFIVESGREILTVLASAEDSATESDAEFSPLTMTRLTDPNTMVALSRMEVEVNRLRIIELIAGRPEITLAEASRYLGFIQSP